MRARVGIDSVYEISTRNPANLVVVESLGRTVLIRAAHNNFSERRKAFLIRQLAAEGYIPDCYEMFTEEAPVAGLTWVIDRSLVAMGPAATKRTRRFMHRLIAVSCVALLLEVVLAFLRAQ